MSATADSTRGDIGRRIAQRREELGLTREEAAFRAGTAPGYGHYLEELSTAMPGTAVLIRLTDASQTSVAALRGGDADLPPGIGRAARHPELIELTAVGAHVAFEVDHIDEALSQGWSVLIRGFARAVTDPGAVQRSAASSTRATPCPPSCRSTCAWTPTPRY
ncbi:MULTISPECIES: helix-turn-helix domain-containing protein [unclassified Streptomyces]|uniref:helix-turn-helix domain-containing protein n=1 Tax=unclassified Streptomyces TaxID=2593676 RepID=UPI002E802348|nr:helix-turn-helix domain-containing protein [Streptomyces sp. NBC_00589]WTI41846.1 pyridoxamine 5'-phosphate oxidase family protein [Streptomyces sp. NBC_00775]WUB24471.1 pyridoxamine 5'-phosphate oxidase family protein [Streptomyces sp. NBC_00589]